uniref:CYP96A69 n=1 Tax=Maesa lanceolata TaxID=992730 RepID=A0A0B4L0K7_MAELA|nr:CYP96A69 [Maesa lanceolata]
MAPFGYTEIILSIIFLSFLYSFLTTKRGQPINWPLVGMTPTISLNFRHIHEVLTEILERNGGTIFFKGAWFTNSDKLFTTHVENIHHILTKNFSNYEKGEEAKEIFDVHGDLLFNADHEKWKRDRKMIQAFFNDRRCIQATMKLVRDSLEKGVIPVLNHVSEHGHVVDLQDLFIRVMLDSTCTVITGYNPGSLQISFPEMPMATAMDVTNDTVLYRHFVPAIVWKLQRWLGVGIEKKMSQAKQTLDDIARKYIKMKGEDIQNNVEGFDALKFYMTGDEAQGYKPQPYNVLRDVVVVLTTAGRDTTGACLSWLFWLLSKHPSVESKIREELKAILPMMNMKFYMTGDEAQGYKPQPYNVLRDVVVVLTTAGRDTTGACLSWLFWLLSKHPSVESKIREELKAILPMDEHEKFRLFNAEELNKLPYLHAAFCETLRLYPPAPYQQRVAVHPDILPSGHRVNNKIKIVFSWYALGRLKSIWGNDCLEFKPERWISLRGEIIHDLSKKYLMAFSTGPRVCPGKNDSFITMKTVAAAVIHNYNVKIVKGHVINYATSIALRMDHGLKVNVTRRWN